MINAISITTPTASTKIAKVIGNFDDGALVSQATLSIDYSALDPTQQSAFDNFMINLLKTDKNVSIINLPYNSEFSIDYINDTATFVDSVVEYDYTALSGTVQGYIDAFNQLMIDLL